MELQISSFYKSIPLLIGFVHKSCKCDDWIMKLENNLIIVCVFAKIKIKFLMFSYFLEALFEEAGPLYGITGHFYP